MQRYSFRNFLDNKEEDTIPVETTICRLRFKLLSIIFEEIKIMMKKKKDTKGELYKNERSCFLNSIVFEIGGIFLVFK